MEERISNLERVTQISAEIHELMQEALRQTQETQRQILETQRQMLETQQHLLETQQRHDDVMNRMAQAIALIQADIVRIDESG